MDTNEAKKKDFLRAWFAEVPGGDPEKYDEAKQSLLQYMQELFLSKSTFRLEIHIQKRLLQNTS
jgi:hypothetical protein